MYKLTFEIEKHGKVIQNELTLPVKKIAEAIWLILESVLTFYGWKINTWNLYRDGK